MITANNLTKRFEAAKALDSVTMNFEDGCIYGLVGSNGSGKSTLLRLIAGVYMADGGHIGIDGVDSFNNPKIKQQIAFLGDTPYFLPQSNLKEMASFYYSTYEDFSYKIYKELLSVFPLDEKARLSTFSKGMQRQAALILTLSTRPRYILLDEAFDGLDVVMRRTLANIIIDGVSKQGMTAIIASHNLRELEDMCDHICLVHEGQLVAEGSVDEIRGRIHKIQVAFENIPEMSAFDGLDIMKIERTGSVIQLVVRGDEKEIMDHIKMLFPVFAECIEPSLEELFVYELEVTGYDVKNILA